MYDTAIRVALVKQRVRENTRWMQPRHDTAVGERERLCADDLRFLCSGGSLLYGLDKLIQSRTGIHAMVAEDAVSCVAIGTGRYIEFISEGGDEEQKEKHGFDIGGLFRKKTES